MPPFVSTNVLGFGVSRPLSTLVNDRTYSEGTIVRNVHGTTTEQTHFLTATVALETLNRHVSKGLRGTPLVITLQNTDTSIKRKIVTGPNTCIIL